MEMIENREKLHIFIEAATREHSACVIINSLSFLPINYDELMSHVSAICCSESPHT